MITLIPRKKHFLNTLAFTALFLIFSALSKNFYTANNVLGTQTSTSPDIYYVTKVVDGDTIDVSQNGAIFKIRLIGINTPETVDPRKSVECYGKQASQKMAELVLDKKVRLVADTSQSDTDKYQRQLRYVFLENGVNINKLMISDGYAYEYTYDTPYLYQTEFKLAEQEAKDNKRGLWNSLICPSDK